MTIFAIKNKRNDEKYYLVVYLKTFGKLGVKIPPNLLRVEFENFLSRKSCMVRINFTHTYVH